jgi:hypothetical protein
MSYRYVFLLVFTSFNIAQSGILLTFSVLMAAKGMIDQNESVRHLNLPFPEKALNIRGIYSHLICSGILIFYGSYVLLPEYFKSYLPTELCIIFLGECFKPFNLLFTKKKYLLVFVSIIQLLGIVLITFCAPSSFITYLALLSSLDLLIGLYYFLRLGTGFNYQFIFQPFVLLLSTFSYLGNMFWIYLGDSNLSSGMNELYANKEKWVIVVTILYPVFRATNINADKLKYVISLVVFVLSYIFQSDFKLSIFVSYILLKLFTISDSYHDRFRVGLLFLLAVFEISTLIFLLYFSLDLLFYFSLFIFYLLFNQVENARKRYVYMNL